MRTASLRDEFYLRAGFLGKTGAQGALVRLPTGIQSKRDRDRSLEIEAGTLPGNIHLCACHAKGTTGFFLFRQQRFARVGSRESKLY
ncbi:hypothetical protein FHX08_005384 [Rhizobium sp. BK529]|uniref:hypothetical protein n=1 Tax=Rhizobium sp. BK418 TaxID=2512120 RepID=UPI001405058A|nr:hypothetical protein [Rhizobium sp. BK418]MBB3594974.1 hypothetical protein [Rhizobium sp. BK529]